MSPTTDRPKRTEKRTLKRWTRKIV